VLIVGLGITPSTANGAASRNSHRFNGTPTVGALFLPGGYPALHTCTASVVRSKHRDIILTAAHCMTKGSDAGYTFVPGYHDGQAPYGTWKTVASYGSRHWRHQSKHSPHYDWAFLRVADHHDGDRIVHLQDVVGGNRLGHAPKAGRHVHVPGYVVGAADKPITCRAPVYLHHGYPAFDCGGYQGGVSGSPWLVGHGKVRTIVGVIGGLHQGGCTPDTSYSARLGKAIHRVRRHAERHRHGEHFPAAPGDGC
jgi:V8-like Glu-specific endopeptidase